MSRFNDAFPISPPSDDGSELRDAVRVDDADLRGELTALPGLITAHGVAFARAHSALVGAKQAKEDAEHTAYIDARERAEVEGEKVTERWLDAKVSRAPGVREARAKFVEAEFEREAAKAVCDGLRAKRVALEALVDLGRAEGSAFAAGLRRMAEDSDERA